MGHNVWTHIYAVQEANRQYDSGRLPNSMQWSHGDYAKCRDIVERIFAAPTKAEALDIIAFYKMYWIEILGSFGNIGKKAINSETQFQALFTVVDDGDGNIGDDMEFDEAKLDNLS
jgi:hypothetical protein